MRLLLLLAACGGAARSPSPGPVSASTEPALTPADVGLAGTPEPEAPAIKQGPLLVDKPAPAPAAPSPPPPPPLPPFYDLQICRPARGCTVRREITRDHVRTELSCPKRGSGMSVKLLRRLALADLTLEHVSDRSRTAADDSLHETITLRNLRDGAAQRARTPLVARRDLFARCLAQVEHSIAIEIAVVIDPDGTPIAVSAAKVPDDSRACIEDTMRAVSFPIYELSTLVVRFRLEVDDPQLHANKPLEC